ncbi:PREDICTED: F-box only protein 2 [Galeopterus variegatus]|uniref:F-box only protein 2 n=1 Tax=Galeopterus variegatus TaxID=482537 RepID=A0ABM0S5K3_GALVR|nr:PREDICTED: F-box only protein 2 [Galeopterus variegatus]
MSRTGQPEKNGEGETIVTVSHGGPSGSSGFLKITEDMIRRQRPDSPPSRDPGTRSAPAPPLATALRSDGRRRTQVFPGLWGPVQGEEAAHLAELPEPLLLRVLAELPAAELVQACRLVCLRWKELVDGAPLWLLKCQQEGLVPEGGAEDERDHWQQFYFLSKWRRNLLRNPCGQEDLEGWCDVEHGGDGWRVEELPGDCGAEFTHDESVKKFFASSFEWCRKAQVIDLQAEGYWEELLDTTQPAIVVKDWYSGRSDAGCLYELTVKLLSEHEDVLAEFNTGQVAVPQDNDDGGWIEISHTFTDYGPGVRFVRFEHGGQDSVYWKGWFGARVTNSSVCVEP